MKATPSNREMNILWSLGQGLLATTHRHGIDVAIALWMPLVGVVCAAICIRMQSWCSAFHQPHLQCAAVGGIRFFGQFQVAARIGTLNSAHTSCAHPLGVVCKPNWLIQGVEGAFLL